MEVSADGKGLEERKGVLVQPSRVLSRHQA